MFKKSSCFTSFVLITALHGSIIHASIARNWTNPNARLPSFTSTYLVGERILLSWLALNQSQNDLWLTRFDVSTDDFALRIASHLDVSNAGSFAWTIAVSDDEVLTDTRFEFQFVSAGSSYDATAPTELASPGFNLMLVNQATLPNGTVANTTTGTPSNSSSSVSPGVSSSPALNPGRDTSKTGLNDAAIAGIAVGVLAAVGLCGFAVGYLAFKRRQARHNHKTAGDSHVTMTGPYEILGDRMHPTEAAGKVTEVHEMNTPPETTVAEAGSSTVHEINNTVKRPGLHEMAG